MCIAFNRIVTVAGFLIICASLHGMGTKQEQREKARKILYLGNELCEGEVDISVRDAEGSSPLHRAIQQNSGGAQMAELLLQVGGPEQLSVEDNNGRMPLDIALAEHRVSEVDVLLFNGAPCKTDLAKLACELGAADPIVYLLWQYGRIRP